MSVSEHANYLLNEYGRLQFDYAAYCKPDGEPLRNEARNNLETYIAELEAENRNLMRNLFLIDDTEKIATLNTRIAELELGLNNQTVHSNTLQKILTEKLDRIAALKGVIEILEDQQREAKNILIDKRLHIDSLYEEGYKLQKRIAELEAAQRWIPVSERLPEDRATVLVAFKNREILTATYYGHYEGFGGVENYWHIEGWHSGEVTHWMPLPEPPIVYGKEREE